jgi:hypothetical protein
MQRTVEPPGEAVRRLDVFNVAEGVVTYVDEIEVGP